MGSRGSRAGQGPRRPGCWRVGAGGAARDVRAAAAWGGHGGKAIVTGTAASTARGRTHRTDRVAATSGRSAATVATPSPPSTGSAGTAVRSSPRAVTAAATAGACDATRPGGNGGAAGWVEARAGPGRGRRSAGGVRGRRQRDRLRGTGGARRLRSAARNGGTHHRSGMDRGTGERAAPTREVGLRELCHHSPHYRDYAPPAHRELLIPRERDEVHATGALHHAGRLRDEVPKLRLARRSAAAALSYWRRRRRRRRRHGFDRCGSMTKARAPNELRGGDEHHGRQGAPAAPSMRRK